MRWLIGQAAGCQTPGPLIGHQEGRGGEGERGVADEEMVEWFLSTLMLDEANNRNNRSTELLFTVQNCI